MKETPFSMAAEPINDSYANTLPRVRKMNDRNNATGVAELVLEYDGYNNAILI